MYRPISSGQIVNDLSHLLHLHNEVEPRSTQEELVQEGRKIFTENLIQNLPHMQQHPMPRVIADAVRYFGLTVNGAHQLFGYNLNRLVDIDLQLNHSRTRLIDPHPFQVDLSIDLPTRFGDSAAFSTTSYLGTLVSEWQKVEVGDLRGTGWQRDGMLYAQIGTEDGIGWNLPPGSIAAVAPISEEERVRPDPAGTYLLLFGNGYRCCGCVASQGRLFLMLTSSAYKGPHEFQYPGEVRIVGRVRTCAVKLPLEEYPEINPLPIARRGAPLFLASEHDTLWKLLRVKSKRFPRSHEEMERVRVKIEVHLRKRVSLRTLRRYLSETGSVPHVNTLIELALLWRAHYRDLLRLIDCLPDDTHHFSLESLRNVNHLHDLPQFDKKPIMPTPEDRMRMLLRQFGEWPAWLSMRFPNLCEFRDRVVRLEQRGTFHGLDPLVPTGTVFLLEELAGIPSTHRDHALTDWRRPIYALERGHEIFCGYLEVDGRQMALVPHPQSRSVSVSFPRHEIRRISQVMGAAVPLS